MIMRAKVMFVATLLLILLFQLQRWHSSASAHEGAPAQKEHVKNQTQRLLPQQTQQPQGPGVTDETTKGGWKGGNEEAGGYGTGEVGEPGRLMRRSEKSSSGGTGGTGGGSGGKGGRSSGGGEPSLRQTPHRSSSSSSSSTRISMGVLPAPCALAGGLVQYCGMAMLLAYSLSIFP